MYDYCSICELPSWVDVHSPRGATFHRFESKVQRDVDTLLEDGRS